MTTDEIFTVLQRDIHSVVVATLDEHGLPQTCVIDLMLAGEEGLYFLTARGKPLYRRLMARPFVALSGMRGQDTLSSIAISMRGAVKNIGRARLEEIFQQNPYMAKIYPTPQSQEALEVFHLYCGEGEYFDLSQLPPYRQSFSFGGAQVHSGGYRICGDRCTGCQACRAACPVGCISDGVPRKIDPARCLHCGNCMEVCPAGAVERLG